MQKHEHPHPHVDLPRSENNSDRAIWLRIPEAVRTRGIGRSTIYLLIREGKIKSRVVKARRDNVRGIRLISADSLDAFIELAGD